MDFHGFPWFSLDFHGFLGGGGGHHKGVVEGDRVDLGSPKPVYSIRDSGYRIQNSGIQEDRIQDSIQDTGLNPIHTAWWPL